VPWAGIICPYRAKAYNIDRPRAVPWAGIICPYRAKAYNIDRPRAVPWAGIICPFRALHKGLALLFPQGGNKTVCIPVI